MVRSINLCIIFIFALVLFSYSVTAQAIDVSAPNGRPRQDEEIPKNIQETLKKQEFERLKKEHEEMLENGEMAVKLSGEVENSFNKSNKLTSEDLQKLEKIEKLLKKIRKELGGDSDEGVDDIKKPLTIKNALAELSETSVMLFDELKKTTRYSISAVAIQSSNTLIDIVRIIRFWKK